MPAPCARRWNVAGGAYVDFHMNRRSRLPRRLPLLRAARHRRERHDDAGSLTPCSTGAPWPAGDWEAWGAAALELGLVPEPCAASSATRPDA